MNGEDLKSMATMAQAQTVANTCNRATGHELGRRLVSMLTQVELSTKELEGLMPLIKRKTADKELCDLIDEHVQKNYMAIAGLENWINTNQPFPRPDHADQILAPSDPSNYQVLESLDIIAEGDEFLAVGCIRTWQVVRGCSSSPPIRECIGRTVSDQLCHETNFAKKFRRKLKTT